MVIVIGHKLGIQWDTKRGISWNGRGWKNTTQMGLFDIYIYISLARLKSLFQTDLKSEFFKHIHIYIYIHIHIYIQYIYIHRSSDFAEFLNVHHPFRLSRENGWAGTCSSQSPGHGCLFVERSERPQAALAHRGQGVTGWGCIGTCVRVYVYIYIHT